MSCLHYRNGELYIEDIALKNAAEQYGTPLYVYSRAAIEHNWHNYDKAFGKTSHRICYAVKANSNIAILNLLAKLNSGFDIVSVGELERVLAAHGDPAKIVFSGVGKRADEMQTAIEKGIYCFNIESHPELELLNEIAEGLKKRVNIAFRINPDINPRTHAHIATGFKVNKFGIDVDKILPYCQDLQAMPSLRLVGLACHIGSQITDLDPLLAAIDKLLELYQQIRAMGIALEHINVGGGLGIVYRNETPPGVNDYIAAIQQRFQGLPVQIIMEPGRGIVGNAGVLLTRVEYLKHSNHKNFVIVDAGMNDFIRPSLYGAWQDIKGVTAHNNIPEIIYDIVGPICESSDFLGKDRSLGVQPGDLLAIDSTGAYGFGMSSNYNSRPRPAEVLIDKGEIHLIRRREKIEELFATEKLVELEKV